jgi:quercetin dioxygenase-like cupin family protein
MQFFGAALIAASMVLTSGAFAQDPVKVDSTHYKVEFENDQVRVLRVTYGPGEKSVMHEHPNVVAVFLNDVQGQFTFPDGKTAPVIAKAGQVIWDQAGKHLPENKGGKPFQVIVVELKSKPAEMKKD